MHAPRAVHVCTFFNVDTYFTDPLIGFVLFFNFIVELLCNYNKKS